LILNDTKNIKRLTGKQAVTNDIFKDIQSVDSEPGERTISNSL